MELLLKVLQYFVAGCVSFTSVCVSVGWLIRIIKGLKKPVDGVNDKLERDYKRINQLDKDMEEIRGTLKYLKAGFNVQLETDKVILEHMRTNNSKGEIKKREDAIYDFLKEHQEKVL